MLFMGSGILDTWHIMQPVKSFLVLLGLWGWMKSNNINEIRSLVLNAIIIHSIIVLFCFVFRDFQNYLNGYTGFISKSGLRVNGFTHSYGTTSLMHAVGIAIAVTEPGVRFRALKIVIVLISTLFLARVGLYISLMFLSFYLIYKYTRTSLLICVIMFPLFFKFLDFVSSADYKDFSDSTSVYILNLKWALESFLLLYESGELGNDSMEQMRLLFNNDNILEYIMGTGDFGRNEIHIDTDVSYLMYFSYSGLMGLCMLIYMHSRLLLSRDLVLLFVSAIIFVTAFKEATFLTRGIWPLYLFFVFENYEKGRLASSKYRVIR